MVPPYCAQPGTNVFQTLRSTERERANLSPLC